MASNLEENFYKKNSIFVIGARGYIGSSLLAEAQKTGSALGTSSSGGNNLLSLRLNEPADFNYSKIRIGDIVLFTAAISSPDICARQHDLAWSVNVDGTSSFIQSVIDCGARVVFFSSDTVYGERENPFDETAICNPAGEYAEMKSVVEQRFLGNASFKSIRLSYVFSQEDKFTRHLAGCLERNEEAKLFHPFYRAVIHRDDVVAGALAIAKHWDGIPEEVINFGGPQVFSRLDFAECLREVYLHGLRFLAIEPEADFFNNRPKIIAMMSPVLSRLLGRPLRTLRQAARLEFA